MKTVQEVVESYLNETRLRRFLYDDRSLDDVTDRLRRPVWERCLQCGIKATQWAVVTTLIKEALRLDDQLIGNAPLVERKRLTICDENKEELMEMSPIEVSFGENHSPSAIAQEWAAKQTQVEWQIDPEIQETCMLVYDKLGQTDIEARDKWISKSAYEEFNAIGSSTFSMLFNKFDAADRVYANTLGEIASMFNKQNRSRNVMPYSRKTSLDRHVEYMGQIGVSESLCSEVLADPVTYLLNGGCPMVYAQCVSYYRIAKTGETNILVEGDNKSSGYVHQLLMMRESEVDVRVFPYRKDFVSLHLTIAEGLRRRIRGLRSWSPKDLIPVAKETANPAMYGAGQTGIFSSVAKVQSVQALMDRNGKWKTLALNPILDQMFGDADDKDKADLFWKYCQVAASTFRKKVPKARDFIDYWMKRFKENSSPEGLWIDRCDGTQVLIPRLRRNKYEDTTYTYEEFKAGKSRPIRTSVSIPSPRMDDAGTAAAAFVAHNRDAFAMATAGCESDGGIKASIHDAALFLTC